MSTFTLTFKTDNAAFRDEDGNLDYMALRDTIAQVADRMIARGAMAGLEQPDQIPVRDLNGNRVGYFEIEED
jgi:hypothetical protein